MGCDVEDCAGGGGGGGGIIFIIMIIMIIMIVIGSGRRRREERREILGGAALDFERFVAVVVVDVGANSPFDFIFEVGFVEGYGSRGEIIDAVGVTRDDHVCDRLPVW